MDKDYKQLLKTDICARLAYNHIYGQVSIEVPDGTYDINSGHMEYSDMSVDVELYGINEDEAIVYSVDNKYTSMVEIMVDDNNFSIYDFTLYLRPLDSMTEDEKKEVSKLLNYEFDVDEDYGLTAEDDRHRITVELLEIYTTWLNKNMFDYRGLIDKGLALPASPDMYK